MHIILPKFDALETNCRMYSSVVTCIVESWLNDDINDSELSNKNYSEVRSNRTHDGSSS